MKRKYVRLSERVINFIRLAFVVNYKTTLVGVGMIGTGGTGIGDLLSSGWHRGSFTELLMAVTAILGGAGLIAAKDAARESPHVAGESTTETPKEDATVTP